MRCHYDRGTIVLDAGAEALVDRVPRLAWDARVGAFRAPAHAWPSIRDEAARLGLDLPASPSEGTGGAHPAAAWRPIALRPYQRAALEAWRAFGRRGVVVLPTGAGKTRVALAAMAEPGTRSLVLVPTRALLAQWAGVVAQVREGPVGRLGDGEHLVRDVTIATYASAWLHAARLGDRFDLLVVDEAHHVGGALRPEVLETSLAPRRLGLTALTPVDPPGRGGAMAELVGGVVFRLTLGQLSGDLAPLHVVGVGLDLTPEERARWIGDVSLWRCARARHALDLVGATWPEVVAQLRRTEEGRRGLAARRRSHALLAYCRAKALTLAAILERHREDQTLVFTADNASARAIASEHLVAPVTCDTSPCERRDLLDAFAHGRLRALVSARVLNEGIDLPDANVAVIVGAGRSDGEHVQRVGRLLRPGEGKVAVVYDLFTLGTGEASRAARRRRALAS